MNENIENEIDIVKVDSEGRIDIPMNVFTLLGVSEGDHVSFEQMGDTNDFVITKVKKEHD